MLTPSSASHALGHLSSIFSDHQEDYALKYFDFIALIPSLFFPLELLATDQTTDAVADFVRAEMQQQQIPGLTLMVSRSGNPKNQEWVSPSLNTTADGSLYFSILDLAKWDAALYTETQLKK